ncbi:hypothetical protein [Acaryochloris sp. IP29b_bin.137]|uniref:hypothetical protein n=1 Tax=Acaryochloris sp. IP29b_bin.137 TaxID=2969217 RepID=UPI00262E9AFD|nr:hypothetical protein [Acaryochloris sp. IP29b_bin.137]
MQREQPSKKISLQDLHSEKHGIKHTAINSALNLSEENHYSTPSSDCDGFKLHHDLTQIPLAEVVKVVQKARPRSASNPEKVKGGKTVLCYGVSQGHYASVSSFKSVGTSSLASCFVVICLQGKNVFFSHVHACNDKVLEDLCNKLDVKKTMIYKGSSPSENTNQMVEKLVKLGAALKGSTATGTVVYDGLTKEITTPGNIEPSNKEYKANNSTGATMGADENLKSM